ncbi:MAG: hypothetical protein WDZ93_01550 [Candidatus Paceibacterota bacterium]
MNTHLLRNSIYSVLLVGALAIIAFGPAWGRALAQVTFSGAVSIADQASVIGALSKGSGSFVIDHPLDPENKLLYHSFVESPDVKNMYDGVVTLNAQGEAVVTLPRYFEALNTDYRYQVKGITAPAPDIHIKEEIENNRFTIAGGPPSAKVSWQVTGIRHDPYILANPIEVEVEKGPDALVEKGEYLFEGYTDTFKYRIVSYWERIVGYVKDVWAGLLAQFDR